MEPLESRRLLSAGGPTVFVSDNPALEPISYGGEYTKIDERDGYAEDGTQMWNHDDTRAVIGAEIIGIGPDGEEVPVVGNQFVEEQEPEFIVPFRRDSWSVEGWGLDVPISVPVRMTGTATAGEDFGWSLRMSQGIGPFSLGVYTEYQPDNPATFGEVVAETHAAGPDERLYVELAAEKVVVVVQDRYYTVLHDGTRRYRESYTYPVQESYTQRFVVKISKQRRMWKDVDLDNEFAHRAADAPVPALNAALPGMSFPPLPEHAISSRRSTLPTK